MTDGYQPKPGPRNVAPPPRDPSGVPVEVRRLGVREALQVLLDQVDYTAGACAPTERVGAVLDHRVIALCRRSLAAVED
jgi:hypothetical protein